MNINDQDYIDRMDNLIAQYLSGDVTPEEEREIVEYLSADRDRLESFLVVTEVLNEQHKAECIRSSVFCPRPQILPMTAMAAQNPIDNECAVRCEGHALRYFGFDVDDNQILSESKAAGWLQPEGTALYNIGRIAGSRGLSVSHRYNCSIDELKSELTSENVVIAALDSRLLRTPTSQLDFSPNHVVVVERIVGDSVILSDSASDDNTDTHPVQRFCQAWQASSYCLVVVSNSSNYIPHPIKLADVAIDGELIELREAMAENNHELWAEGRRKEGWTYGPVRNQEAMQTPCMVPYNKLPEAEKEYDRQMAEGIIKLLLKLGWKLSKKE